ncbi:MAG: molybdopterin-synthase adenylyltransferase MoeB [Lachnospiraceae bacterium]|nr:molybdopterin-synthase adenylyltransferase MoeB [Lachnospiraceae bacterium]
MQQFNNHIKEKPSDISVWQMNEMSEDDYICIDMRGEIAYQHGHIPGAICWDCSDDMTKDLPGNKKLIVYCSYGENSIVLADKLKQQGFEAYNLAGGYREWLLHNFEELSAEELKRYDRQIILPEVGSEGQKKLKKSKVLIVGAGGLGSPAAVYLAGAGIGTIGIMDADTVSISNLQRQIAHNIDRENINKAESAKLSMQKLNDKIEVISYPYALTADNAEEIIGKYDFIIDAVDNFETKFLLNDTCVLLKKPFCHAGILRFEGQVMTYVPGKSPCYRCIFEEIPESGSVPNCSQAGIIGAVAGIIGSIQALEAIKYLLNIGELLTGKIFVMNGLSMETRIAHFGKKNERCRVCGSHKTITDIRENSEEYMRKGCKIN